jgi:hypothetical protein
MTPSNRDALSASPPPTPAPAKARDRAKVGVSLAKDRHRQGAFLSRDPMVTGSATAFGRQARGRVLLEAAQPTKHLAPLQPDQHTGVTDRIRPD